MKLLRLTPTASVESAASMTRRTPKRAINAPANGPQRPNSRRLIESASEMTARSQPNSCSSGRTRTARVAPMPAEVSSARNVTHGDDPRVVQPPMHTLMMHRRTHCRDRASRTREPGRAQRTILYPQAH